MLFELYHGNIEWVHALQTSVIQVVLIIALRDNIFEFFFLFLETKDTIARRFSKIKMNGMDDQLFDKTKVRRSESRYTFRA